MKNILPNQSQTILFISPHFDDVAFSCAGLIDHLIKVGFRVIWATVFSSGVQNPTGFALECQTSKGIPVNKDYMEIRRQEDITCANILRVLPPVELGFLEAPHRGYNSTTALFGERLDSDALLIKAVGEAINKLIKYLCPIATFIPLGIGRHIDHRLVVEAIRKSIKEQILLSYCESPYIIRCKQEELAELTIKRDAFVIDVSDKQAIRAKACAAYASQLYYQLRDIGTVEDMADKSARHSARISRSSIDRVELFFSNTKVTSDIIKKLCLCSITIKKDIKHE